MYFRIDPNDNLESDPAGYEALAAGETGIGDSDNDGTLNINEQSPVTIAATDLVLPIPANDVVSNPLLHKDVPAEAYDFGGE